MKILLLGDAHLRYRGPESRKDDFFQTQFNKMVQVLDIYEKHGCELLLQAGDLFDTFKPPNYVMASYIRLLKSRGIFICSVLGQHDVSMHNLASVERSAVNVLRSADVLLTLSETPASASDVNVYGASWKQPVPTPARNTRAILVIHEMIGDHPLYPGHQPIGPKAFLHTHSGYELILCGDYHYPFLAEEDGRKIVNCGALVRLSCKEEDKKLQPQVAIYDTATRELIFEQLKVQPAEDVFRDAKVVAADNHLAEFVEKLKKQVTVSVSFRDNLFQFFADNPVDQPVKDEILLALEEVGQK